MRTSPAVTCRGGPDRSRGGAVPGVKQRGTCRTTARAGHSKSDGDVFALTGEPVGE